MGADHVRANLPSSSRRGDCGCPDSARRLGLAWFSYSMPHPSRPRDTFLDVGACDIFDGKLDADIVVLGASEGTPHLPGQPSHAAEAPDALRRAVKPSAADLSRWDFDQAGPLLDHSKVRIRDGGNLLTDPGTPERNRDVIRTATARILAARAVPVLLGGDDSVPIPFFEAFEGYGPITIVQIDAHLDWRDERNGLRHTFSSPMRRASEMPWIERIVQIGMRGVGGSRENDLADARRWGAIVIPASALRRLTIRQALDHIPNGARCIVTLDCDGLDPSVIPAVIVPQPGGLSYGDVIELLDGIAAKARIVGFDLVELVPHLDVRGLGTLTAARLVCKALGCIGRQRAA
jgi:agmatinase